MTYNTLGIITVIPEKNDSNDFEGYAVPVNENNHDSHDNNLCNSVIISNSSDLGIDNYTKKYIYNNTHIIINFNERIRLVRDQINTIIKSFNTIMLIHLPIRPFPVHQRIRQISPREEFYEI